MQQPFPATDLIKAAHQQITREWWQSRARFDLYISQLVLREASAGDAEAANLRLEALKSIPALALSSAASALAQQLVQQGPLPENAVADALHIGIATVNGMDYLLTWNCTHIANAAIRQRIEAICRDLKEQETRGGREVVSLPPKRIESEKRTKPTPESEEEALTSR